jgi:hypothetical protein
LWRARRLSRARASRATWPHFLADQADVILALCGCPAAWHIARHRAAARRLAHRATGDHQGLAASAVHQLRQVFTVLLLGLGMLARRAKDHKTIALVQRMQRITRMGAGVLSTLDQLPATTPESLSLLDQSTDVWQRGDDNLERFV